MLDKHLLFGPESIDDSAFLRGRVAALFMVILHLLDETENGDNHAQFLANARAAVRRGFQDKDSDHEVSASADEILRLLQDNYMANTVIKASREAESDSK